MTQLKPLESFCAILYLLLTGLAGWGLSDTAANGDVTHYNSCELEAQGKINAENRKLTFSGGRTVVVVEDSTSYHCSIGLYTEELKYSASPRYTHLWLDVFLYVSLILASVLLLIGLCMYNQWLLVPWLILMAIDIVRGLISVFFIFWFSYGNLARIATGIFFLGLQFFHISLLLIIMAKFQRIHNRRNGIPDKHYDGRPYNSSRAPSAFEPHAAQPPRQEFYDSHRPFPPHPYDNQHYR
ncbi:unnamed protein product [Caenorhabditis auriculariae]|uniref:Uncharacterized protein n=1 Tax=Caenorhabditis auriculariae TaxID=2777116 RepID=A0A8S1GZY0_9PELO|nr:unnamed protein product [Caenorhabditis auriculariae]